VISILFIIFKT